MQELRNCGYIHTKIGGEGGGAFLTVFEVSNSGSAKTTPPLQKSDSESVVSRPAENPTSGKSHLLPIKERASIKETASKELVQTPFARNLTSEFEAFWNAYPKKVNKKKAQQKFKALAKTNALPDITTLVADIENRTTYDSQWADKKFIPHPTTYLNGERWNDELQQSTPGNNAIENQLLKANEYLRNEAGDGKTLVGDGCALPSDMDESEWRH